MKKKNGGKELTFEQRNKFGIQVPKREETNLAYANRGDLEFEDVGKEWGLDFHGVSHSAGFADLDQDGDLDCIINNYYSPSIVYENTTQQSGRLLVELRSGSNNHFGIGSKIEVWQGESYQRRDLMPGRGYLTSDPMSVHFGVDSEQPIDRLKVTWPGGHVQEFSNILANNSYRVVDSAGNNVAPPAERVATLFSDVTHESKIGFAHRENDFNDFQREPLLPFQLSRLGGSVACGDINSDGMPDLFFGGASGQPGALFVRERDSYRKIEGPWDQHAANEDMGCLFFDANGDGNTDLFVTSGGNEFEVGSDEYGDRLYINLGNEKFKDVSKESLPDVLTSSFVATTADFDRDGDLDLFVGSRSIPGKYPLSPDSHLLINEGGKFSAAAHSVVDLTEFGLVNSAVWSDFNNDGWMDLVIAREWQPIAILQNKNGQELVEVADELGLHTQSGWWHGVAASDLDDDGDIDFVFTNQGNNTKYHATAEHPHRLYYEDFDNNGSLDLVEAEFEGDIEYPIRGRSCSSQSMPFVGDKFPTFRDFSLATLDDIYETEKKPRPNVELNYLESVVAWNDGENGFELEPLPKLTQISPGFGVAIRDFDADGVKDIMIANNFFGSQPETGYMDGGLGLFLKGNGDRGFSAVWPEKSGIVVPSDANGLAVGDFDGDGDDDAVFAINNEAPRIFYNNSRSDIIELNLTGPQGNSEAIGTRVEFFYASGKSQTHEVVARTSYLSQSQSRITISRNQFDDLKKIELRWPDGSSVVKQIDHTRSDAVSAMNISFDAN
jgi:hypothetical protein